MAMTCDEALEMISAALDGELSAHERRELDAHMAECPDCKALFDELAGQSQLLRELDCQVPEDLSDRVLSKLPRWRAPARFWRQMGAVAVSLALVLSLGALYWSRGAKPAASGGSTSGAGQAAAWSRTSEDLAEVSSGGADAGIPAAEAEIPAEPPIPQPSAATENGSPGDKAADEPALTAPADMAEEYSFTARVLEIHDRYLLVEVTDNSGYSSLSPGSRMEVSTGGVSCPELTPGDCAEIVFDGTVLQTDPGRVQTVFAIDQIR